MKISSHIRFIITLLVCIVSSISAMNPNETESALSSLTSANRRAYKRLRLPQNLNRFAQYGKIGNKYPQDIVPDDVALTLLKPAHKKLVYRYDEGIFSHPKLKQLLRSYLEERRLNDWDIHHVTRNLNDQYFTIYLNEPHFLGFRRHNFDGQYSIQWKGFDLVGEQNIAAKIMLLKILKRGDTEFVKNKEHLKKVFFSFSPLAQNYLDLCHDIIEKPYECPICYRGVYSNELIHPECCDRKQSLCFCCYQTLNRCPYCYSQDYKKRDQQPLLTHPQVAQSQLHENNSYCTIQ